MGDKIEFPLNNDMYMIQATRYIMNNEYDKAIACMAKVYETTKTYEINYFYTVMLYQAEYYEEALEIASDQKEEYLVRDRHLLMYTELLIKNHQFIEAELIIKQSVSAPFPTYLQEWGNLEKELRSERELLNFEIEMKRKETKRKLRELKKFSITDQSQILNEARNLSLENLKEVAPQILSDPFISGQTQRAFLEILVEMGDETRYDFPWFNQLRKVRPMDLIPFHELSIVKNIEDILQRKLHKIPHLIEIVKIELLNDFLLLYPFIEDTITDINYWIDLYVIQFIEDEELDEATTPQNTEQEKLYEWVEYLNQISQR